MYRIPRFLRWLTGGLIAIALLSGILLLNSPSKQELALPYPSTWPQLESSPQTKPLHMVLIQVNDPKQRFIGGLLLIKDGANVGIADVNPHVVLDLRNRGQMDLRRASHEVTSPDFIHAMNVASGLSIDGALVFKDVGVAALVDGIGGITVTASQRVRLTPRGLSPVEYLPAGTRQVKGEVAANFAMYSAPLNSKLAQQRLRMVVTQLLDGLPSNPQEIEQLLSALGQSGRSSMPTTDLAKFFEQTRGKWKDAPTIVLPEKTFGDADHPEWKLFDTVALHLQHRIPHKSMMWNMDEARMLGEYRLFVAGTADDRMLVQKATSQSEIYFIDGGAPVVATQSQPTTTLKVTAGIPKSVIQGLQDSLKLEKINITYVVSLPSGADMQLDVGEDLRNAQLENGP